MKVVIVAEIDLDTGEYEITFRNKSNPGQPMELSAIKQGWLKMAKAFADGKIQEKTSTLLA